MQYARPIVMQDGVRPSGAFPLAGGWAWFDRVAVLARGTPPRIAPAADLPDALRERLCTPRAAFAGLTLDRPRVMGILNVTPDSFSDGGRFATLDAARACGLAMVAAGADIIDIGGESTRPGAEEVPEDEEITRTAPVIASLREAGATLPLSIDTRKAEVARVALRVGATAVNDVSALSFDPDLAGVVAGADAPIVLMHAQGAPATMQHDPRYDDVLLDVYDALAARVAVAEAAGIPRARIAVDPGIGFGKTVAHNLALIRGLSLFHGLGCAILLGASRKRFIAAVAGPVETHERLPGSLSVALAGAAQGAQLLRVHDVGETKQALALWQAVAGG